MTHRIIGFALLASAWLGLAGCVTASDPHPVRAVSSLDLPRYMGRWFEVAKYPNRFQTQCVADTTATYRLEPDGGVRVDNRCKTADGGFDEAIGRAERSKEVGAAKFKVRFAPAWLGWLDLVWGDYWVIDIDRDYSLVAVSEPRREYLWILAREPIVNSARYQALLDRLRQAGFDTDRLVPTRQGAGG